MYKNYIVNYKNKNGLLTLAFSGSSKPYALHTYLDIICNKSNEDHKDISELKMFREDFAQNGNYTLKEITGKVNKMIEKM